MLDTLIERWAARKDPRFKLFIEAKKHYEQFLYGSRVRFYQMGEADYQRALNDQRVLSARHGFSEAAAMSKNEGVLVDEAVARYQLGMVCHACGDLEESVNHMRAALGIYRNLGDGIRSYRVDSANLGLRRCLVGSSSQRRLDDSGVSCPFRYGQKEKTLMFPGIKKRAMFKF